MVLVKRCVLGSFALSLCISCMLLYLTLNGQPHHPQIHSSPQKSPRTGSIALAPDLELPSTSEKKMEGYLVHTSNCQVPDVDMWHKSVLPYVKRNTPSLNCRGNHIKPDLTYAKGNMLFVNNESIPSYGNVEFCEFVEVLRPKSGDSSHLLGKKRYVFKQKIAVKKEFIKVYCYNTSNAIVYTNLHAFTPTNPALKHLKDSLFIKHRRKGYVETMNVLMIGIDSVSRLNFHRQFPKTAAVLKDRLGAYEMFGYNKVRDNTFINLVPMFLGKYVEETKWNEMNASNHTFDRYPYMWKVFADSGYHTLFAEDAPAIAIWNFEKPGFTYSPADYYLRPFSLAMASTKGLWYNNSHCFGQRLETDITLDYVKQFITTRGRDPYFAFTFLTRPTYDDVNQNTDASHFKFLNSLIDQNLLDNTVVIYFSDHGARRGDILSTYVGKLEERLPAMFVSLPRHFIRKYPLIAKNLKINQNRLTTPFDIYALLNSVLRFYGDTNRDNTNQRAISLFDKIPEERSCQSATIDDHWCTCMDRKPVDVNNDKVIKAANEALNFINNKTLSSRSLCVFYTLKSVTDALVSEPKHKLLTFKASFNDVIARKAYYGPKATGYLTVYLVTIVVSPSDGTFQASVLHDSTSNKYYVSGDISRTSLYGKASWCVNDHLMKKYCYCNKQL